MQPERIRVLHVDDHADYVNMPAARLEEIDDRLVVDVVDTVADALSILESERIDCIVTEFHVGDDRAIERLRAASPSVPVVLFTEADLAAVESVLTDGPTEYVAKDVASNDTTYRLLAERIGRLVETTREPDGPALPAAVEAVAADLSVPVCVLVGDEPTYANDAFRERFGFESVELDFEAVASVATDADRLAAFLRDPDEAAVEVATDDGRVSVHATVDEPAVATLWLDAEDDRDGTDASIVESLLRGLPQPVFAKDERGRYVAVSDAFTQRGDGGIESPDGTVYRTAADVRGTTDFDLFPAGHATEATGDDERVVEQATTVTRTHRYVDPTGRAVERWTSKAPWYDEDGTVRGVVGVSLDVSDATDGTATERLAEIERALDGPLAEQVTLTRDSLVDGTERDDAGGLAAARRSLDTLATGLEAVGDLARYGRPPTATEPVDVGEVAAAVWAALDTGERALSVATDSVVDSDPERLRTLFECLFENAVAFGGPDVEVRVEDHPDGFVVVDDGGGVDPTAVERLTEVGYTSTDAALGLGLPVAARIADGLGWEMSVEASSAGGLRVTVTAVAV